MKRTPKKTRGFTVIELLTISSMIAVMTSLAVPAMQDAREAARRTRCKNNLKQHGLALHNYHDVYRSFPPGWVLAYGDASSHSGYGWESALLPYMEQANLYQKLNHREPFAEPTELLALGLEVAQCPSSSAPAVNAIRGGFGNSNYSGNYGSEPIPRWTGGRMEAWWPGGSEIAPRGRPASPLFGSPVSGAKQRPTSGLFRWNSNTRIRDITDGTSNTIMVGERSVKSGSGIWIGVQSNRYENDVVTDASVWSPINRSFTGYSSEHGQGVNVGLCDGSVRFLSEDIESKPGRGIFQDLADISDGEVIPPSTWK